MKLTPDQLKDARQWIADCQWRDLDADQVDELTDAEVERAVVHHYDGGLNGFLADYL